MNSLNILIVDDEAPARNRMKLLLGDLQHEGALIEAKNGVEALALIAEQQIDVMLLDIRMPVMDGIETAGHCQKLDNPPVIIFTTAYDEHALKAFDLNAVDYLLKPIRAEKLQNALAKAVALRPKQLAALKPLQSQRSHLSINERGRLYLVPISEIIYFRAELKYITVRTALKDYLIEDSLNSLEIEFAEEFIRFHRNSLVAKKSIIGFEKKADDAGEIHWVVLLKELPETISVSRRQQHLVRKI